MESKIIERLKEELTIEELEEMAKDCISYNGSLDRLDYWENDEEFFDVFFEGKPMEAVRSAHYGNYNYTDAYVKFDAYGNLKSASLWEYEEEIKDYNEEIIEQYLKIIDESWDSNIKNKIQSIIEDVETE